MTIYNTGDIVIAPFPFVNIGITKPRPILVLSHEGFNNSHGKLIALMITTASRSQWPSDIKIRYLEPCGLDHTSFVRMKCFTLDIQLITKYIGRMHADDLAHVKQKISSVII